ncbi:E3 ubiquitin-protein ligase SlrP, partial [Salmonella enterica subsp. enterica serovar Heidelberg str. 622737-12]
MFNITNIQSTARHQSISNEASTEVPLKEEIWNKISAFSLQNIRLKHKTASLIFVIHLKPPRQKRS